MRLTDGYLATTVIQHSKIVGIVDNVNTSNSKGNCYSVIHFTEGSKKGASLEFFAPFFSFYVKVGVQKYISQLILPHLVECEAHKILSLSGN